MSLNYVKELLSESDCTCIAVKGDKVYQSKLKGIMPIISKLKEDSEFFNGADVADVVIGKASALLLIYGNVGRIYTPLISEHAVNILEKYNIYCEYDKKVPFILNRNKDGMCPMEQAVIDVDDPKRAYEILLEKIS